MHTGIKSLHWTNVVCDNFTLLGTALLTFYLLSSSHVGDLQKKQGHSQEYRSKKIIE